MYIYIYTYIHSLNLQEDIWHLYIDIYHVYNMFTVYHTHNYILVYKTPFAERTQSVKSYGGHCKEVPVLPYFDRDLVNSANGISSP